MNTVPDKHWLDSKKNVKRLWRGFLVVLALTVFAEFFVHLHATFALEGWFGFHAWFGFITCVLMIVGAKFLARFLKRPDTFYAEDGNE
jgi:hypothetical protein